MNRTRLAGLILFGAVVGFTPIFVGAQNAGGNAAANMCIAPDVAGRIAQCPANAPRPTKGEHSVPNSHLSTSKRHTEEKKQGPTAPQYEIDPSHARGQQGEHQLRAEDLLRREIELTARLATRTPASNPQRPDILLRLAEDHFELQQVYNARVRGFDQPIYEACDRDHNQARCRELHTQQTAAEAQVTSAREAAIRAYAQLVQDHPNFRRMDEVLFSLGYALEEMRQFDRARQVYYRLIKGFPQSRFIPNAYLSFAEYFFGQSQMAESLQFYQKVTEIPSERNPVYGYAIYKQAWVQYNLQDFRASLQRFVDTIEFATANPEATDARNLARQARRELVLPYAQVGSPARALEFFRRYAENEQGAIDMFEQLGELYYDTGAWGNTISVYHDLMGAQPTGDKVCYWQSRVTNAIISSRPKAEQTREVQRMVDLYEAFTHTAGRSQEGINSCKQATASVLVELATAWHREAVGTDTQPGTHDRNTMHEAETLYQLLIEKFPDMENMQFPDIDRRDWPTLYRIAYYYAELLWNQDKWRECGPAFDHVVDISPQGEFTADAAMAAVLCYDKLYQEEYQPHERERRSETRANRRGRRGEPEPEADPNAEFRRRDFTPQETGMANAFHRFICYAGDNDELPNVKYHLARLHYLANQYEEAAILFKDIAWNHRESELAEFAANLYLDSLNVLLVHADPRALRAAPRCPAMLMRCWASIAMRLTARRTKTSATTSRASSARSCVQRSSSLRARVTTRPPLSFPARSCSSAAVTRQRARVSTKLSTTWPSTTRLCISLVRRFAHVSV
ncbi:MAG: tetratricopeptide repeat protein [Sandaracinaceae bacterium]|nr:tetratricopeptide repeat protein [Sandaracinaceae bacterium]